MNTYTKEEVKSDRFIITKVQEEVILDLPITEGSGNAIMTHIGAYRQIKFILNGKPFISEINSGNYIALTEDKSECITMNDISFDKDIESNWKRYIHLPEKTYWVEAI